MSVREEDRQKNSCSSRGLGVAAVALGVGVGAALYYFFNKRPENPDSEGSTSSSWVCEEPQAFRTKPDLPHPITMSSNESYSFLDEDDYETVSENTTTDTSILTVDGSSSESSEPSDVSDSSMSSITTDSYSDTEDPSTDTDASSWDVTENSIGLPSDEYGRSPIHRFLHIIDLLTPTSNGSRQRSWSLEECSICCEVMLKDQELEELPCAHSFHAACVRPWLNEQRTCPNCRKLA